MRDIDNYTDDNTQRLFFGDFLDEFYRVSDKKDKMAMLEAEPEFNNTENKFMVEIAAAVHKLSDDNNIPAPPWVFEKKYYSDSPIFAFDTKNKKYQDFLINTSPDEYASRNIFLGDNVLRRV